MAYGIFNEDFATMSKKKIFIKKLEFLHPMIRGRGMRQVCRRKITSAATPSALMDPIGEGGGAA
jgi:hypothetical protein